MSSAPAAVMVPAIVQVSTEALGAELFNVIIPLSVEPLKLSKPEEPEEPDVPLEPELPDEPELPELPDEPEVPDDPQQPQVL